MILGNTGTGKTFAMEYLADFFKEMCGIRMEIISASDIARIYAADGDDGFWRWFCDKKSEELIIDDLGAERNAKHFGNGGIMPEVITKRYDAWRGSGVRTHFTSNLDLTAIKSRYGERITSRLAEMITLMTIAGKDYRMAPPVNKNAKDASEDGQMNIVEKNAVSVEFQKQIENTTWLDFNVGDLVQDEQGRKAYVTVPRGHRGEKDMLLVEYVDFYEGAGWKST